MKMTGFTKHSEYRNMCLIEQDELSTVLTNASWVIHIRAYTGSLYANIYENQFLDINWVVGPDWLLQWPR